MLSLASSLGVRLLFERGSLFTHCAHICCEICTEKSFCIAEQSFFLHFFKHIYSIVKSLKHGAICNSKWVAQKSPILQKVSHPLVWFWCAGGSRQLVYALNFFVGFFFARTERKCEPHFTTFSMMTNDSVTEKRAEKWTETARCYWPFKKRSFDFSSSLTPCQETQHCLSTGRLVKVRAGTKHTQICTEGVSVIWGSEKVPLHEAVI